MSAWSLQSMVAGSFIAALGPGIAPAHAADARDMQFPLGPVRIVVPYAAGGGGDIISRLLGARLSEAWGQPVIVDNRPGAGTVIGTDLVAKAQADGRTLLVNTAAITINPGLLAKLPYDTLSDLAPVSQIAILPNLLVISPSLNVRTVGELIARARTPPVLAYGSSGTGTVAHLAGELFRSAAKIELTHVPYKGGSAVMPDLMGGRLQMTFATIPSSLPFVKSGKAMALAVASGKRSPALPDVPTIAEAGLPGFDASNWIGVFAPGKTAPRLIGRIHRDLQTVVQDSAVTERMLSLGFEPVASSPADFAAVIRSELPKWQKVIAASGAKAD
jgi:tripartite-type tricarboxylate transporter receptor subunit TctC